MLFFQRICESLKAKVIIILFLCLILPSTIPESCLILGDEDILSGRTSGLVIDHAYLRRPAPGYDPGTVHLFLRNETDKAIGIGEIRVNDVLLPPHYLLGETSFFTDILDGDLVVPSPYEELPSELFLWYQVAPNPIPPNKVGDLMVKLALSTSELISIEAITTDRQRLRRVIQPKDNPFKITFIGFSDEYDKLYVYLQNDWNRPIAAARVYIDTTEVTSLCYMPWKDLGPAKKRCLVITLNEPLVEDDFVTIRVDSKEDDLIKAQATVRPFARFAISSYDGDTRSELCFDPNPFFVRYENFTDTPKNKSEADRVCCLFADPNTKDRSLLAKLGETAKEVIARRIKLSERNSRIRSFINIDEHEKPRSYFVYGETADIIAVNPYEFQFFKHRPERDGFYTSLGKAAAHPRPIIAISEAFVGKSSWNALRYPTPEEERLVVYSEIAAGAKGILYYRAEGDNGYKKDSKLEKEIGRINSELRLLRRFLKIGEPINIAHATAEKVRAQAIQCGYQAIILVLLNEDYKDSQTDGKPLLIVPKRDFDVIVEVPEPMQIVDAFEATGRFDRLKLRQGEENKLEVRVKDLDTAKAIVLTTDEVDYDYDTNNDGISDVAEARSHNSKL